MKVKFLHILCVAIASLLFSCKNTNVDYGLDTYYVEITTAQNTNEFLLDNGQMIVASPGGNAKAYSFGDRVLLNYTLLPATASGSDNNVRINGSAKIPLGKLALTSASAILSAAKEPIRLESVWMGSHYLNVQFYFDYKSATHSIGLLADSIRMGNDTIRMYFTHNSNNDPPGYPVHSYLSFDLGNVLGNPGNARPVSIQINTSNYGNKSFDLVY